MKLCFVKLIGSEYDDYNIYEFIFTNNITDVIVSEEDYMPSCLNQNVDIVGGYTEKYTVKTKIKFDLIQDNCCFSFLHARIGAVALCVENIDSYTDYPSDGRLVFMFGEPFDEVDRKLAAKKILMLN